MIMNKAGKVAEYVREVMDLYDANDYGFFREYDKEVKDVVERPLFINDTIDDETLEKVSVNLGLAKEEILRMDMTVAKKYWYKYPFFRLYNKFKANWNWFFQYKNDAPSAAEYLLYVVFDNKSFVKTEKRYDYEDIKQRLLDQIKQIDEIIPGTYHSNADITNLSIETEVIFSYPECSKMIKSFLDMVDRLKYLFFKVLESDLTEEEINEMNFLSSWLEASDKVAQYILTYETVKKLKNVYLKEGLNDFFLYAKIKRNFLADPWTCKEFFDDYNLVERFACVFPLTKVKMREFALNVSKFSCNFVWSDAKPFVLSKEEEEEIKAAWEGTEFYTPIEERRKEVTHIYVNKTPDELYDWMPYIEKIQKAASPEKMGGIRIPVEYTRPFKFEPSRMIDRIEAVQGGNK